MSNVIDISDWCGADLDVIYCMTKDNMRVRARICGLNLQKDADGNLFAELVALSPMWGTGYFPVGQRVPRGNGVGEWEWVKPPKIIRELEAIVAEATAKQAEQEAADKRAAAAQAQGEVEGDDTVRDGSRRAAGLRRVAAS